MWGDVASGAAVSRVCCTRETHAAPRWAMCRGGVLVHNAARRYKLDGEAGHLPTMLKLLRGSDNHTFHTTFLMLMFYSPEELAEDASSGCRCLHLSY